MQIDLLKSAAGRRVLFAALYFSEGAPIGFIWWAVPAKLRKEGVPIEEIGAVTAMLVLPWALKFLWAPLVDEMRTPRFGLRAWILTAQLMMGLTLAPLLWLPMAEHLELLSILLIAHALCAATQDVAIDALCISSVPVPERGATNGWMQVGMLVARGTFGGLALAAEAYIGQTGVIAALIGCVWCSGALLFFVREPAAAHGRRSPLQRLAVFAKTVGKAARRRGTWLGFAFAATAGAAFEATGALASPMLIDADATQQQVGYFFAFPVILCMVGGALPGGWISDRAGRRLTVGASLGLTAILAALIGVIHLVQPAPPLAALFTLIAALYVGIGLFTASSYALFMDLTDPDIAATQFSAFMGATNLCEAWSVRVASLLIAGPGHAIALGAMAVISLAAIPLTAALPSSRSHEEKMGPPPTP